MLHTAPHVGSEIVRDALSPAFFDRCEDVCDGFVAGFRSDVAFAVEAEADVDVDVEQEEEGERVAARRVGSAGTADAMEDAGWGVDIYS